MTGGRRPLTTRERQVLELLAQPGETSRSIAVQLDLSEQYVRNLTQKIYGKLGVRSRAAAVEAARSESPA